MAERANRVPERVEKGQERWIVLRGPAEAINLEKITFDRSTLNSILPEEEKKRRREEKKKENTGKKENGCRAGVGQEGNRRGMVGRRCASTNEEER